MSPTIILLCIAAYFLVILCVAAIASRRRNDSPDFFNGGRRMPWPLVACAMIGSAISGVTFISVPGMVITKGYTYLQMVLGFIVGYLVIAALLVPLFYKRNLLSIYGYLEERFGLPVRRTGAWFFLVSKILGASVRFYVVCAVLQLLVFDPLGVPFIINVIATVALIWLYTFRGGVTSLVWTDLIKSLCLILSVALAIGFVAWRLGFDLSGGISAVTSHDSFHIFNFSDPKSSTYFWKQFIAGIFMAIAMNGLDQDMMQRHLSCPDSASSRKNMITSGVMQFFIIALFLLLGTLLMLYVEQTGMEMPQRSDELFGLVATSEGMPVVLGIVFIIGLVAAAYSAAGSAMTSLTTSFTLDILDGEKRYEPRRLEKIRLLTHAGMAAAMIVVIITFYYLSSEDAISAVYTLASYTYGPLLALFTYGLIFKGKASAKIMVGACIGAPIGAWIITRLLHRFCGYETGFELLLINAGLAIIIIGIGARFYGSRRSLSADNNFPRS